MALPAGRVFNEYRPVFCNATPQAEIAPVQDVSEVGLAFWASGSGCEVEITQSAFPAVSALVLSKSTLYVVAACAAWVPPARLTAVSAVAPASAATPSLTNRRESRVCAACIADLRNPLDARFGHHREP